LLAAPVTSRSPCAAARQELGAYVLGALAPADRSVLDQHLVSCPRCREELAALAGLPALLRRVPLADAALLCSESAAESGMGAGAPGQSLASMLDQVARVRRRRSWLTAAATVLIAAMAVALGLQAWPHAARLSVPNGPLAATATGFSPVTRAGATVRYSARAWGTQVQVHVRGMPTGTSCQFWVISAAGRDIPTGGWTIAGGHQDTWYPASTWLPVRSLRGFQVTSTGKTLVTIWTHRHTGGQ
jgi:hypothetical protein